MPAAKQLALHFPVHHPDELLVAHGAQSATHIGAVDGHRLVEPCVRAPIVCNWEILEREMLPLATSNSVAGDKGANGMVLADDHCKKQTCTMN